MADLRDTTLGFLGVPFLAGGAALVWPRAMNAMAVSPEWQAFYTAQHRVQDRRLMAYVFGGTALASLLLSQTRAVGEHGRGIAEGGAMGAAVAAVVAYALSLQAQRAVPPRPVEAFGRGGALPPPGGGALPPPGGGELPPPAQRTMVVRPDELEVPAQLGASTGAIFESLLTSLPGAGQAVRVVTRPPVDVSRITDPAPAVPQRESLPPPLSPPPAIPPAVLGDGGSFLTGEGAPDPNVVDTVRGRHAEMDRYYREEWRPRQADPATLPLTLPITSHVRRFADQARIVADQLRKLGASLSTSEGSLRQLLLQILSTRSIPGHSRHHWGTDVDVVSTDSADWRPGGALARLLPFVREEAPRFGFVNPYRDGAFPEPTRPHYNEEPWHLSYAPIAQVYTARWAAEVLPQHGALLDRAARVIAPAAGVDQASLRAALGSLDLPSYVRNVAPAPEGASV